MNGTFFNIIMLAISLYVLYAGITGKGKLYAADNVKDEYADKFPKVLRKMFLALGVVMLLMSACNFAPGLLYEQEYYFTASYTDPNGVTHEEGDITTLAELQSYYDIYVEENADKTEPTTSSSSCLGSGSSVPVPFEYNYRYVAKSSAFENIQKKVFDIVGGVFLGLSLILVVGLFIAIRKMTDKNKKRETREKAQQNVSAMPSDAFHFDDDAPDTGESKQE